MRKCRFTEGQTIGVLKQTEAGAKVADLSLDKEALKSALGYAW